MSNKKEFVTLIKNDARNWEWYRDKYVAEGKISGFMEAICGNHMWPIIEIEKGTLLATTCEPEKYYEFMTLTERRYPGLCEFDYYRKQN